MVIKKDAMGTDATLVVEKYIAGKGWKYVGYEADFLDGEFLTRNYALYGILANEESAHEVIDSKTTKGFISISPPRGVPKDADPESDVDDVPFDKDPYLRWSPTWVTLYEILNFPHWEMENLYEYITTLNEYKASIKQIHGNEVLSIKRKGREIPEKHWKKHIESEPNEDDQNIAVEIRYRTTYRERCKEFFERLVPKLSKIDTDPKSIRVIVTFW